MTCIGCVLLSKLEVGSNCDPIVVMRFATEFCPLGITWVLKASNFSIRSQIYVGKIVGGHSWLRRHRGPDLQSYLSL